jgi:toxin-antitoxin system PIN domain toxin
MIIDANLLLFATNPESPFHVRANRWLTRQLNGESRVGLPWDSLSAFLRVATNPRAFERPMQPGAAVDQIEDWLASDLAWIPTPTDSHARILGALIRRYELRGNLIPDARLAALAIEHGVEICSADTDFARFTEVRWRNPLAD